jgi:heptosyltransferase-2
MLRPPNWLGDAVLALPAIEAIRRHFARDHLTIAGGPVPVALFGEVSGASPDALVTLPPRPKDAVAILAAGRYDLAILFPNSFRSAWTTRRAGIPERWGYAASGRRWLLTRAVSRRARRGPHQADYYRTLVERLGLPYPDSPPRLEPTEASRARARVLLPPRPAAPGGPLIGFAPGAAYGQAKQWPPDRVADVCAALLTAQPGAAAVLVGADHDRPAALAVESTLRARAPAVRSRVIDLVGRTTIGELIGVIHACDVFVSNDSGAMHVAAALGRPVVAVFGATDERVTGPLGDHQILTADVFCRPCLLRDCPIDHRCMTRITPDTVLHAITDRLARLAGSPS